MYRVVASTCFGEKSYSGNKDATIKLTEYECWDLLKQIWLVYGNDWNNLNNNDEYNFVSQIF